MKYHRTLAGEEVRVVCRYGGQEGLARNQEEWGPRGRHERGAQEEVCRAAAEHYTRGSAEGSGGTAEVRSPCLGPSIGGRSVPLRSDCQQQRLQGADKSAYPTPNARHGHC